MGERVIVSLDALGLNVGGALAEKIWTALRAAGIEPLKVSRHGDGWMASVEVPDEAATQPVDAGGPFSALDTWMFRAKKAEAALAAQAKQASTCWRTRAEKAEAAAEENCRRAERAGCASMFDAAERSKLERRIVVLDDELSKLRRQPTAGDRVRGLVGKYDLAKIADGSGWGSALAECVVDLLPLIAAELDKQDAAEKFLTWVQSMPDPGSTVLAEGAGGVASAKDAAASIFEHVFKYAGCAGVEKAFAGIERAAKAASDGSAPPVRHSFDRLWAGAYANALAGGLCRLRLKARQLVRVDAPAAKQPACERVIVAPDGTPITVVHRPAERHYDSSWSTRWAHLDSLVTGPVAASPTPFRPYRHNPTDAEVLADYAAWTERTKR